MLYYRKMTNFRRYLRVQTKSDGIVYREPDQETKAFTNDYWMRLNSLFDDNEKEKKNLITIFPDDLFFFDETDSAGFYN